MDFLKDENLLPYLSKEALEEFKLLELLSARASVANKLEGLVPLKFLWKNILKLSDEDIESFGDFGECGPSCGHDTFEVEEDEDEDEPWKNGG